MLKTSLRLFIREVLENQSTLLLTESAVAPKKVIIDGQEIDPLGIKLALREGGSPVISIVAQIDPSSPTKIPSKKIAEFKQEDEDTEGSILNEAMSSDPTYVYIAKVYEPEVIDGASELPEGDVASFLTNPLTKGVKMSNRYLYLGHTGYRLAEPSVADQFVEKNLPSRPIGHVGQPGGRRGWVPPTESEITKWEKDTKAAEDVYKTKKVHFAASDTAAASRDFMLKRLRIFNQDFYENFPGAKRGNLTWEEMLKKLSVQEPGIFEDCVKIQEGQLSLFDSFGLFMVDPVRFHIPGKQYTSKGAGEILDEGCPLSGKEYIEALNKWLNGSINRFDEKQFVYCSQNMADSLANDIASIVAGLIVGALGTPGAGIATTIAIQIAPLVPVTIWQLKNKQYVGAFATATRICASIISGGAGAGIFGKAISSVASQIIMTVLEVIAGMTTAFTFDKPGIDAEIRKFLAGKGIDMDTATIEELEAAANQVPEQPLATILPKAL